MVSAHKAILPALVLLVSIGATDNALAALVDTPNAACRERVGRSSGKLGSTITKAYAECFRYAFRDDAGDCSTIAAADIKNKVPAALAKVTDGIGTYCDDTTTSIALDEHTRCGVPVGTPVSTFADLSVCLPSLVTVNLESLYGRILNPNFAAPDRNVEYCARAIAKGAVELFKTVHREKTRVVEYSDDLGGDSVYVDPGDPALMIASWRTRVADKIAYKCESLAPEAWSDIGSCANDLQGVIDCVLADVESAAAGIAASGYTQPGICPSGLSVAFRGGAQGGEIVSATDLDYGHTGFLHNADFTDGGTLRLDLDCGAPTDNACASCTVASSCEEDNCRCEHDNSLVCDEPFGPDADDCAGNDCEMFLGPPLPTNAGGVPGCMINNVDQAITGSSAISTGQLSLDVALRAYLHLAPAHNQQCPYCEGGLCTGGERDGLACDVDASSDFGDVSYDCPPEDSSSITPLGLLQNVTLGTSTASLPSALPCDPPLGFFDCACSACTGDLTLACNSDAECSDVGAGTCMLSGAHGGALRLPNPCNDQLCQLVGPEEGRCTTGGPDDLYCDGYVKGNGGGVVSCIDNSDCAPGVVGFDAGFCTLVEARPCFRDPLDVEGTPGLGDPTLAGAFCVPPLGGFIFSGLGFPGPARMTLATHVTPLCSDGVTFWGTGGANCPPP